MLYREKPVVIKAYQFFANDQLGWPAGVQRNPKSSTGFTIVTLEGSVDVSDRDWIITADGGRYPCKPDVFEATYERADAGAAVDLLARRAAFETQFKATHVWNAAILEKAWEAHVASEGAPDAPQVAIANESACVMSSEVLTRREMVLAVFASYGAELDCDEVLKAAQDATRFVLSGETQAPDVSSSTLPDLAEGEQYAGVIVENGKPSHHVILLPGENASVNWADACAWATEQGGTLPSRREQSLLFANLKSEFESAWYWSAERHESNPGWAWSQSFYYGTQGSTDPDGSLRARAVRRLPI